MGFETLYEAIRKSRIVSAFPGGSPVTVVGQVVMGTVMTGCVIGSNAGIFLGASTETKETH